MSIFLTRALGAALAGSLVAVHPVHAASETVLYSFGGGSDGAVPGGLIFVDGTFFGTTSQQGGNGCAGFGCGTVFRMTPKSAESVVYSFQGGGDGADPFGALIDFNGALYGTTVAGGGSGCAPVAGCGTIFKVKPNGIETILHQFGSGGDGAFPRAGLVNLGGALYGTTQAGGTGNCDIGTPGCGSVFKLTRVGVETVLYSFQGNADGLDPLAGLLNVNGVLYGTTSSGGNLDGYGTVFKLTRAGMETVLHRFSGGSDGSEPLAGLTNRGRTFYGTTYGGGTGNSGTVFKVTDAGAEAVLYSFKGGSDGAYPVAGLIKVDGAFYGTTAYGGGTGCGGGGCGTVFKVTPAGVESVLYAFKGRPDGAAPQAGLIKVGGALYGTTISGGTNDFGTVFRLRE